MTPGGTGITHPYNSDKTSLQVWHLWANINGTSMDHHSNSKILFCSHYYDTGKYTYTTIWHQKEATQWNANHSPVCHRWVITWWVTVTSDTWWAIFLSNMTQMSRHTMVLQLRIINFWYNILVSHHSQSPLWLQWTIEQQYMTSLRVVTHRCESNEPLFTWMTPVRLYVTINVPVAYMARDGMLLMRANPLQGPLEGGALKIKTFRAQKERWKSTETRKRKERKI